MRQISFHSLRIASSLNGTLRATVHKDNFLCHYTEHLVPRCLITALFLTGFGINFTPSICPLKRLPIQMIQKFLRGLKKHFVPFFSHQVFKHSLKVPYYMHENCKC